MHDSEKKNSRVLVHLDPELKRIKEMVIEFDFAWLELQGRSVKGSTLTAHKVDRVVNAPKSDEDLRNSVSNKQSPGKNRTAEASKAKGPAETMKDEVKRVGSPPEVSKKNQVGTNSKPSAKEQSTFDFQDN